MFSTDLFPTRVSVVSRNALQDVCSGRSGHAEVVLLEYDPEVVAYEELLEIFWKTHDPTQARIAVCMPRLPYYGNSMASRFRFMTTEWM